MANSFRPERDSNGYITHFIVGGDTCVSWRQFYFAAIDAKICGVSGAFEKCMSGIKNILERKIPLTIKTVGTTLNRDEIPAIKRYVTGLDGAQFKFDSEIRTMLQGDSEIRRFQLPQSEIKALINSDTDFSSAQKKRDATPKQHCGAGKSHFHIDARGVLQLCSSIRDQGYDLRNGNFQEGFYKALPGFSCDQMEP